MQDQDFGAVVGRFAVIPTSTLSDVLDSLGLQGVLTGIHAVAPDMKVVGPAVTVKEVSGSLGSYPLEDFRVGDMIQEAGRGDVLVVDNGGECLSTCGFLASFSSKVKGIAGIVVDGGVRDVQRISEIGFPVFTRHIVPLSGKRRIKIESFNTTISIENVRIEPGDIIVGDDTGVVVVPAKRSKEILQEAERLERLEEENIPLVKPGVSLSELSRKHKHL